jgi:hypothetical protein
LAKCALDTKHPNFLKTIDASDGELQAGLDELCKKLAKDHTQCNWFCQPMPGFPAFQNKIWKWDFAPENSQASTRKSWRLLAYVEDPNAPEPIPATAFLLYYKGDVSSFIPKELAKKLNEFIVGKKLDRKVEDDDRFRRYTDSGVTRSLCCSCFALIAETSDPDALATAEENHLCP